MNKLLLIIFTFSVVVFYACTSVAPVADNTRSIVYKNLYEEKPATILLMPPINRSVNVEAKEYFHSTLLIPLANAGYYVIPPLLSMEMLKKESAYDAEMFLESPLNLFGDFFGADMALFTIIHKWDKSGLEAKVRVEVEYIFKSTKSNNILYSRRINMTYDTSVSSGMGGLVGALVDITASAINTAATKEINIARVCNSKIFDDLPAGKYSANYLLDGDRVAGSEVLNISQ